MIYARPVFRLPSSVVLDVDGVLWIAGAPGTGAVAFVDGLRRAAIPFSLLTNTCTISKAQLWASLTKAGFTLCADHLLTAAELAGKWLRNADAHTIIYLGAPDALPDVAKGLSVRNAGPVDAVVVGDLFADYDRRALDRAAKAVCDGATLVAMQRNTRWFDGTSWYVDIGFWVAGLEYVTGRQAHVTGKPNPHAYHEAVTSQGLSITTHSNVVFVSDDVASDLKGAKEAGLATVHFGSAQRLRPWVDHAVPDMTALESLLLGRGHD